MSGLGVCRVYRAHKCLYMGLCPTKGSSGFGDTRVRNKMFLGRRTFGFTSLGFRVQRVEDLVSGFGEFRVEGLGFATV